MGDDALTLARLNGASHKDFVALLAGTYEHSPWVVERAWPRGPFPTLAQLKRTLVEVVTEAERDEQLALLRSHPELAGKAMAAGTLTAESSHEQGKAGLTALHRRPSWRRSRRLNAAYRERFGFPFMLAVRGPRGDGPRQGADHRHLRAPPREPPRLRVRRGAAQRPPRRRAAPRRPLRRPADARRAGLGLRRAAGAPLRPGLRRERPAHRHLPHRRAPRLRGAARALDARVRLRRGQDRRGRQRRRRLSRREAGREDAAHRLALRHGAQRRQLRRPARHLRADDRACAS